MRAGGLSIPVGGKRGLAGCPRMVTDPRAVPDGVGETPLLFREWTDRQRKCEQRLRMPGYGLDMLLQLESCMI